MGFNPFKAVGKAVKGIAKPFKKVLRSPIGKVAGLAALYYGAPAMFPNAFGGSAGGAGWKKFIMGAAGNEGYAAPGQGIFKPGVPSLLQRFKDMGPLGKAATVGGATMATSALAEPELLEESKTVVDTSGHEGYLNARKNFIDEWASWYMQQGDDEETAYAKASEAMFNDGGIVGLAQGGRIGMATGMSPGEARARGLGAQHHGSTNYGDTRKGHGVDLHAGNVGDDGGVGFVPKIGIVHAPPPGWAGHPPKKPSLGHRIDDAATRFLPNWLRRTPNIKARQKWAKAKGFLSGDPLGVHAPLKGYEWMEDEDIVSSAAGLELFRELGYVPASDLHGQGGEGEGAQAEWRRLGYPSQAAYLAAMQGGGGGGGGVTPTNTTGDYYGFQEWQDWDPNNTTPLFGDATQYKALLNKGGRIGLYAGGMGVMNNPMNPMMNRGLGAMGSPGMNPYNQQNLMAQGQMRGNPMMGGNPMMARGNPMMGQRPGIPAQGPGISGTQAAASLAKKEEDSDLLKLIRMLASMGIPMEQLRGRTKEELVEMAISLQKDQPTGRPEVVEESEEVEEEVMTAAGGGRVRAAEGYPNPEEEYIDISGEAGTRYLRENHPGLLAEIYPDEEEMEEEIVIQDPLTRRPREVITEDEEEEISIPQKKNPFKRQGMEFNKPVGREGTFRADNPPVVYSLNEGGLMRTRYAMGSEQPVIPSKDGPQIDYRAMGGYQPHGKKEKHDDVRALLAQGEFVVTSDAVKGIGGGDRDLGAKRMYDMMHKYEPIGRALS